MSSLPDPVAAELLQDLIRRAKSLGAEAADALLVDGAALSVSVRLGQTESVERSEAGDLGLRVFVGKRMAIVSSSDRGPAALAELAERAVAMARTVPEDPYCGLADEREIATAWPDLDLYDPHEPGPLTLTEAALAMETAALAVPGVSNSDGADANWSSTVVTLAASNGFVGGYRVSRRSLSVSVLAGSGTGMERDYDYHSANHQTDLESPELVGRRAGERTVRKLGARKMASRQVPIIYDPRVSASLVGHFAGAVSGAAIARGVSFLKDRLDQPVFAPGIAIVDDPHVRRGPRSKPFDGEGVAGRRRPIVADGVLKGWFLDLRSARQLGLETTGNASRGAGGPPSPQPTNLYLSPGALTPDALMADIAEGFYVTDLMGQGVSNVTGDYSRGANGFWIENGRIAYPVSEVTIAGNLKDMFARLTPANDLTHRYGIDAPTVRIEGMTVAGT